MDALKDKRNIFVNPLGGKRIGRRTGKDITAGKLIRKDADGYDNFDDYWSESEADTTRDSSSVKDDRALPASSQESAGQQNSQQSNASRTKQVRAAKKTTHGEAFIVHPLQHNIGRRTGKDIKAGKNIRKDSLGYENFDDYWSESEVSSLSVLARSRGSLPSFTQASDKQKKGATETKKPDDNMEKTQISGGVDVCAQPSNALDRAGDVEPVYGSQVSILSSQESQPSSQTDSESSQEMTGTVKKQPLDSTRRSGPSTDVPPQTDEGSKKDDTANFFEGMAELDCPSSPAAVSPRPADLPREAPVNPRVAELRTSGKRRTRSSRRSLRFADPPDSQSPAAEASLSARQAGEGDGEAEQLRKAHPSKVATSDTSVETSSTSVQRRSDVADVSKKVDTATVTEQSATSEVSEHPDTDGGVEERAAAAVSEKAASREASPESDGESVIIETCEESIEEDCASRLDTQNTDCLSGKKSRVDAATETTFFDVQDTSDETGSRRSSSIASQRDQTLSASVSRTKVDATCQITPSLMGETVAASPTTEKEAAAPPAKRASAGRVGLGGYKVVSSSHIPVRTRQPSRKNESSTSYSKTDESTAKATEGTGAQKSHLSQTGDSTRPNLTKTVTDTPGTAETTSVLTKSLNPSKTGMDTSKRTKSAITNSSTSNLVKSATDTSRAGAVESVLSQSSTQNGNKTAADGSRTGGETAAAKSMLPKSTGFKTIRSETPSAGAEAGKTSRGSLASVRLTVTRASTSLAQSSLPSASQTRSSLPSASQTRSSLPSASQTQSSLPSASQTQSSLPSASQTRSSLPSASQTQSSLPSASQTQSSLPSASQSRSSLPSASQTRSSLPSASQTQSSLPSASRSRSSLPSASRSRSSLPSASQTRSSLPSTSRPSISRGGDLNGSLTLQEERTSSSATSPMKSFGTRKRLSYTLAEETDSTYGKISRLSKSRASSIPESIEEEEEEEESAPDTVSSDLPEAGVSSAAGARKGVFLSLTHHSIVASAGGDSDSSDFYIVMDNEQVSAGKRGKGKRKAADVKPKTSKTRKKDQMKEVGETADASDHKSTGNTEQDASTPPGDGKAEEVASQTKRKRGRPRKPRAEGSSVARKAAAGVEPQAGPDSSASPSLPDRSVEPTGGSSAVGTHEADTGGRKGRKKEAETVKTKPSKTGKKSLAKKARETPDQKSISKGKRDVSLHLSAGQLEKSDVAGLGRSVKGAVLSSGRKGASTAGRTTPGEVGRDAGEASNDAMAASPLDDLEGEGALSPPSVHSGEGEGWAPELQGPGLAPTPPADRSQPGAGTSSTADEPVEVKRSRRRGAAQSKVSIGSETLTKKSAPRGPKRKISFSSAGGDETDKDSGEPSSRKKILISSKSSRDCVDENTSRLAKEQKQSTSLSHSHSGASRSKLSTGGKSKAPKYNYFKSGRRRRRKVKATDSAAQKESKQKPSVPDQGETPREKPAKSSSPECRDAPSPALYGSADECTVEQRSRLQGRTSLGGGGGTSEGSSSNNRTLPKFSRSPWAPSSRESSSPLIQVRRRGRKPSIQLDTGGQSSKGRRRLQATLKTSGSKARLSQSRRGAAAEAPTPAQERTEAAGATTPANTTTPTNTSWSYRAGDKGGKASRSRWGFLPHVTPKSGVSFRRSCYFRPDLTDLASDASLPGAGSGRAVGGRGAGLQQAGSALTPCLAGRGAPRGRTKRRVTICEEPQPSPSGADSGFPSACGPGGESGLGESSSSSPPDSDSVVHFCETTHTTTPGPPRRTKAKIIYPEPAPEGLRRSKRVRVQGLEWYKNERIVYSQDEAGLRVMSIEPSREAEYLARKQKNAAKRRLMRILRKEKKPRRRSSVSGNTSLHAPVPTDLDLVDSGPIPVINPENNASVLVECMAPFKSATFLGPSLEPASPADPYVLTCQLRQRAFTSGNLVLRPLAQKPTERVESNCLVFHVVSGVVLVTIHKTATMCSAQDKFFVPMGSTYSLQNMRKDEARLSYVQLLNDDDGAEGEDQQAPSAQPGTSFLR